MAGSIFGFGQNAQPSPGPAMAGAPQALQLALYRDPRLALASQLSAQGTSAAPVQHWTQAAARLAQALAGNYVQDRVTSDYEKEATDANTNLREGLAKALAGDMKGANEIWGANKYNAGRVLDNQLAMAQAQAKSQADLANDLAKKGLRINPQTNQVEQIPGFGQSSGAIEGAIEGGKRKGVIGAEASMVPDLAKIAGAKAGAEAWAQNPAIAARGETSLQQELRYKPQIAAATTGATLDAENAPAGMPVPGAPAGAQFTRGGAAAFGKELGQQTAQGPQQIGTKEADLRKEFTALPVVKSFTEVTPLYQAALSTADRKTKASDLNLVYAFGKLMDPGSVVREGEMVMVNNTSPFADILNRYTSALSGKSALSDETRNDLLREMQSRYGALKAQYGDIAGQYSGIARQRGLSPGNILPAFNLPDDSRLAGAPGRGVSVGGGAKIKFLGFE